MACAVAGGRIRRRILTGTLSIVRSISSGGKRASSRTSSISAPDKFHEQLDTTESDIIVMGVGAEIDAGELRAIGRDGAIVSKDRAQIAASFQAAAARVEAYSKRYYLLGYCSPARAGEHVLRIEARAGGRTGSYEHKFDARGFGPNCDPTRPPAFNIKRPKRISIGSPP